MFIETHKTCPIFPEENTQVSTTSQNSVSPTTTAEVTSTTTLQSTKPQVECVGSLLENQIDWKGTKTAKIMFRAGVGNLGTKEPVSSGVTYGIHLNLKNFG